MPHLQLRLFLLSFLFGIWIPQNAIKLHLLCLVIISIIITFWHCRKWWLLALLIFCGGTLVSHIQIHSSQIHKFSSSKVESFTGYVSSFPDIRLDHQKIYLETQQHKILIHLPLEPEINYGDRLKVSGKLSDPPRVEGFNYKKYLERFGVQKIMRSPQVIETVCQQCDGNWFITLASKLRNWMRENLAKTLPSPHRELSMGILLGVKKELPPSIKESFHLSGLQHILVVSGSNIAIIMLCFQMVFKRFGPWINITLSMLGVGFFVLMAGLEAPVIRAALMGSLAGLGMSGGLRMDAINALLLSSCMMGIMSPSMIQSDLGFWLSFSATLGIITLSPVVARILHKSLKNQFSREVMSMSFGAQIAVSPLLFIFFGAFPTGGLFANILIEPLMPFLMFGASVLGCFGSLPQYFTWPFQTVTYFGFEILIKISQWFSAFPTLHLPKTLQWILLGSLLIFTSCLILHPKWSEIYLARSEK